MTHIYRHRPTRLRPHDPRCWIALLATAAASCSDPTESGQLVPRTVRENPDLPQITLRGVRFHAEAFGPAGAPTLIMLHGGPGGDYRGLLRLRGATGGRRLEDEHRLVFWDQAGSGLSERLDPEHISIDSFVQDLTAIIDHYAGDAPVYLIGHSWGGMLASHYISQYPERVQGAVLLEPGPLTGALYTKVADELLSLDLFSEGLNDFIAAERVLSPEGHARRDYLLALGAFSDAQPAYHLSKSDPKPFWRMGAVANEAILQDGTDNGRYVWDFTLGLQNYEPTVLFIAGELNTAIGVTFQEEQLRFYGNAKLEVIPGAGHDLPWTAAEEVVGATLSYLDALESELASEKGER